MNTRRINESEHLRADGNLSYIDFLRLVSKLWLDAHPGIPILASGDKSFAQYPVITYRLDLRKAHPSEPKPKQREIIRTPDGQEAIHIMAQRFQSVVTFNAVTQIDPHTAEVLIETFEDFMLEFTPVFKQLGLSEIVYVRRLPDAADSRPGEGVVERQVSYLVTTEKIIKVYRPKFESIVIDARVFLQGDEVIFETNPTNASIFVYGQAYKIGDRVRITSRTDHLLPPEITSGFYHIGNIITASDSRQYTLSRYAEDGTLTPVTILSAGSGYITAYPDSDVVTHIVDQA